MYRVLGEKPREEARSSPSDSDSHSAKNAKKPKTTSKSTHACNIHETALRAKKTLLIGEHSF
jgi:hypothetical protein